MNALLKKEPKVGVIFDKRGDPPYQSVGKLWQDTLNIISNNFKTEIFETDDFYVRNSRQYQEFTNEIDIMMLLSPYYSIDRSVKKLPIVFYGLGSMQKGGHWLYDNRIIIYIPSLLIDNNVLLLDMFSYNSGAVRLLITSNKTL